MNKRVENRMRQIEANIAVISEELGLDRKATYRYVFETGLACVRACAGERAHTCTGERAGVPTQGRTSPRKRDLNSNSNLSTNRVCGTSAAEAATHTQPISLGGLLRSLPKRVPESYALWWWRYMKDREWQLTNGRRVTPSTWRMNLITFYNAAKSGEIAEAKEEYDRFFAQAFPAQEKTAAEIWDSICATCDNLANGHCVSCALKPPTSAAECPRFKPLIE